MSSCSELTNSASSCRHSGEFALREAIVRLMPSASAMSVTVCREASTFAIRARSPQAELGGWSFKTMRPFTSVVGAIRRCSRGRKSERPGRSRVFTPPLKVSQSVTYLLPVDRPATRVNLARHVLRVRGV
jgi:hypothetical protein